MSTIHHEVFATQMTANQANAQKSTGPRTPEGKACAALNTVKHGAYARADNSRRHILLRRGEDPVEYEWLHQDLINSWQPDDSMQAMLVKTLGDKPGTDAESDEEQTGNVPVPPQNVSPQGTIARGDGWTRPERVGEKNGQNGQTKPL